jgi:hypothetical protein
MIDETNRGEEASAIATYRVEISIHVSVYLFNYLFIYLSIHPSIHPSIYPSIQTSTRHAYKDLPTACCCKDPSFDMAGKGGNVKFRISSLHGKRCISKVPSGLGRSTTSQGSALARLTRRHNAACFMRCRACPRAPTARLVPSLLSLHKE